MYECAVEIMIFSVGVNIYFLEFQLSVYYQTITQHIDDWLTNRTLLIFGNAHKIREKFLKAYFYLIPLLFWAWEKRLPNYKRRG